MTEAIILSLIVGYIRGGRIIELAKIPLKRVELIVLAVILKFGADYLAGMGFSWINKYNLYIQITCYLMMFIFFIFNYMIFGMKIISVGTLFNFLVIIANKGYMPVWSKVLSKAQITFLASGKSTTHTLMVAQTKFKFLADIIYISPPYPFRQLISIGDIFISIGVFVLIQKVMTSISYGSQYKISQYEHKF